jgi:CheY-like chemotaxis protein
MHVLYICCYNEARSNVKNVNEQPQLLAYKLVMAAERDVLLTSILDVLVVEDTLDDANLIVQTLRNLHPGVSVTVCHDGVEALDCLFGTGQYKTPYTPQLILLDVSLPKVSGLEVLRVIRSYARTRTIPVVILSGSVEEDKIAQGYELGVNSYVVKPHDLEQFRQIVRQIGTYWMKINMPQSGINEPNANEGQARSDH